MHVVLKSRPGYCGQNFDVTVAPRSVFIFASHDNCLDCAKRIWFIPLAFHLSGKLFLQYLKKGFAKVQTVVGTVNLLGLDTSAWTGAALKLFRAGQKDDLEGLVVTRKDGQVCSADALI